LKLHADSTSTFNTITAYGPGYIDINQIRHTESLFISPNADITPWSVTHFDALKTSDFDAVLALTPEVVLLGTGTRQRIPHPQLIEAFFQAHIGVEAMDTAAACRTYNILMAEGRRVVAALIQEQGQTSC